MTYPQHSEHRTVVFRDQSRDVKYLTRSTRTSEHSTTWSDGKVYPVIDVDLPWPESSRDRQLADSQA